MLVWEDTLDVRLDDTMAFGLGYDFDGMEFFREEAETVIGRFMIWPQRTGPVSDWALYGGALGWFQSGFTHSRDAKIAVERMHRDALAESLEAA